LSLLKIRFALKLDRSSWLRGSFARSGGAGQPARRVALLRAYDKRTGAAQRRLDGSLTHW
jgi:hypothetical protein